MYKKYIQGILGCLGLAILVVLSTSKISTNQTGQPEADAEQNEVSAEAIKAYGSFWNTYEKERFGLKQKRQEETVAAVASVDPEPVSEEAAAVTEEAAQIVQPEPEPEPEPNTPVVVAAPEPEAEATEGAREVPVITSVEAPGDVNFETITVAPSVEEQPPVQNHFSAEEQMASIQGGCMIMGNSYTYLEQMVRYYRANQTYPEYYRNTDAPTIEDFCRIYIEEAQAEGVRVEVAFCQAMKETGFLRYLGDVRIEQFNFAGIGATGNGVQGNYFADVRSGVRAQIQHLKAYASTDALNNACVDPRFYYVQRGTTPYVEWLGIHENPFGGGWAAAMNYGGSIINDYIVKLFSN